MTGFLLAILGILTALGMTALGDMVSEEVRDRLDHLPHAILRLASKRLNATQRGILYNDDWMPELIYILKGTRPGRSPVCTTAPGSRSASWPARTESPLSFTGSFPL